MSLSTFLNSSFMSAWQTLPGVRAQVRALERAMPQEEEGNIFLSFATCSCTTSSTCISFPDMSPALLTEEWIEVSNVPPVLPLVGLGLLENKGGKVESGRKARLESNEDRQGHWVSCGSWWCAAAQYPSNCNFWASSFFAANFIFCHLAREQCCLGQNETLCLILPK